MAIISQFSQQLPPLFEMEKSSRKPRTVWTKEETEGLLDCYAARKEEFHSRGGKRPYESLLEDMVSRGISNCTRTVDEITNKIRKLLAGYKTAVDSNKRTGASPCHAPYMDKLEDIFGDRPIIANKHTIDVGVSQTSDNESSESCPTPSTSRGTLPDSSRRRFKRQKMSCYLQEKLDLKEKFYGDKTKIMTTAQTNLDVPLQKIVAIEQRKLELEEKRLKILEDMAHRQ